MAGPPPPGQTGQPPPEEWEPPGSRRPGDYREVPVPGAPPQPPPGYWPPAPPRSDPPRGYFIPRQARGNGAPPPGYWPPPDQGYGAPPPGYWSPPGYGGPPGPPPGHWVPQQARWPSPLPKAGSAKTGPLPLHPMSLGDILDASFRLMRANFWTIAGIISVLVIPLQLAAALAQRSLFNGNSVITVFNNAANGIQTQTQTSDSQSIATSITALISFLILPFAAGAISKVVAASYLGETVSAGQALGSAARRWWALLLAWFFVHLLEILAGIALILPGLLIMALYVSVAPAIVTERLGPFRGMRRSWRLNRPRMWGILGICIVSGLIFSVTADVVSVPLEIGAFAVGLHWGWILLFAGGVVASLVSIPLNAIVATLVYFDGQIRNEGFDLRTMSYRLYN